MRANHRVSGLVQLNVAERLSWCCQARRQNKLGGRWSSSRFQTSQRPLPHWLESGKLYEKTVVVSFMKPGSYIPQSTRLLDQLREVLRYKHYGLRTEEAYVCWVKFFVRWHTRNGQARHPRDMGASELQQFFGRAVAVAGRCAAPNAPTAYSVGVDCRRSGGVADVDFEFEFGAPRTLFGWWIGCPGVGPIRGCHNGGNGRHCVEAKMLARKLCLPASVGQRTDTRSASLATGSRQDKDALQEVAHPSRMAPRGTSP